MVLPTTSGTVSAYPFNMQRVIDHAFRRAGRQPERAGSENLRIAQDLIYTLTSQWINAGFPLWTREYLLLGAPPMTPDVPCPIGTVDVIHCYWRMLMPWRGPATTTNGGDASQLFGGQPNADVLITGANPGVYVGFGGAQTLNTIGILLGGTTQVTDALQVQVSSDGATWVTIQTLPSTTFVPGQWAYFDLNPSPSAAYIRVIFPAQTTLLLNQVNYGLPNHVETSIGPVSIDDYWNLPNQQFPGDWPNTSYVDRQLNFPVIKIWPILNQQAFYNGIVTALVRRYIQDPGLLTNAVEVPQRWIEALIWRLAALLMFELSDMDGGTQEANAFALSAKQQRMTMVQAEADKAENLAWAEERTPGPIRWAPRIGCYTK